MQQSESSDISDSIEEDEEFRAVSEDDIEMAITDISNSPPRKKETSQVPALSFVKTTNSTTPPRSFSFTGAKKTHRAVQQQLSSYIPETEAFPASVPMNCDSPEAGPSAAHDSTQLCNDLPLLQPYKERRPSRADLEAEIKRCKRNELLYQSGASHVLTMYGILCDRRSYYESLQKDIKSALQKAPIN
jgi:hypothetical protein